MRRTVLERTTFVPASLGEVFAFFSDPQNLARITPPSMGFVILDAPQRGLRAGDLIDYRILVFGLPLRWRTRIESWAENESFSDLQMRGPYRYWLHTHTFHTAGAGTEMHDRVEYALPMGSIGRLAAGWLIRRQLKAIFDFRAEAIGRIYAR